MRVPAAHLFTAALLPPSPNAFAAITTCRSFAPSPLNSRFTAGSGTLLLYLCCHLPAVGFCFPARCATAQRCAFPHARRRVLLRVLTWVTLRRRCRLPPPACRFSPARATTCLLLCCCLCLYRFIIPPWVLGHWNRLPAVPWFVAFHCHTITPAFQGILHRFFYACLLPIPATTCLPTCAMHYFSAFLFLHCILFTGDTLLCLPAAVGHAFLHLHPSSSCLFLITARVSFVISRSVLPYHHLFSYLLPVPILGQLDGILLLLPACLPAHRSATTPLLRARRTSITPVNCAPGFAGSRLP